MQVHGRKHYGFTLIEAMLLLVILSIIAVAAGVGLQAVAKVPARTDDMMAANSVMVSAMEQVRAGLFASWPAATYSTPVTINSTSYPVSLTINNASGYSTPTSGSLPAPIALNGMPYVLNIAMSTADPGVGSAQTDFMQVTVAITPLSGTTPITGLQRKLVCYVAQP
jgi:type II secretory pathway pseudopilin PulG